MYESSTRTKKAKKQLSTLNINNMTLLPAFGCKIVEITDTD